MKINFLAFVPFNLIDSSCSQKFPKASSILSLTNGQYATLRVFSLGQHFAIVSMHSSSTSAQRVNKIESKYLQFLANKLSPIKIFF